jgi:transcriptional regulator with XRE-family HTH domain
MRKYQRQKAPREGMAIHPLVYWMWTEMNRQRASQEDIAKRSGVSSSAMRKWRTGDRSPRMLEFDAIANALGYSLVIRRKKDD